MFGGFSVVIVGTWSMVKMIGDRKMVKKHVGKKQQGVWILGEKYFIRTVTMALCGRLVKVTDQELVIEDASWVADTGRFSKFLVEGTPDEVEPFPEGEVIVGRGSLIDATVWKHDLLRVII